MKAISKYTDPKISVESRVMGQCGEQWLLTRINQNHLKV